MSERDARIVQGTLNTLAIVSIIAIVVLSWLPKDHEIRTGIAGQFEHVAAYLATGAVTALAARGRKPLRVVLAFASLALVLEIGQLWVPGRTAQAVDWVASMAGAALGTAAGVLVARRLGERDG